MGFGSHQHLCRWPRLHSNCSTLTWCSPLLSTFGIAQAGRRASGLAQNRPQPSALASGIRVKGVVDVDKLRSHRWGTWWIDSPLRGCFILGQSADGLFWLNLYSFGCEPRARGVVARIKVDAYRKGCYSMLPLAVEAPERNRGHCTVKWNISWLLWFWRLEENSRFSVINFTVEWFHTNYQFITREGRLF